MTLNGLSCAYVPLRNYSLTHRDCVSIVICNCLRTGRCWRATAAAGGGRQKGNTDGTSPVFKHSRSPTCEINSKWLWLSNRWRKYLTYTFITSNAYPAWHHDAEGLLIFYRCGFFFLPFFHAYISVVTEPISTKLGHIHLWLLFEKYGPNPRIFTLTGQGPKTLCDWLWIWPYLSLQQNMTSTIGKKLVSLQGLPCMPPNLDLRMKTVLCRLIV